MTEISGELIMVQRGLKIWSTCAFCVAMHNVKTSDCSLYGNLSGLNITLEQKYGLYLESNCLLALAMAENDFDIGQIKAFS